MLRAIFFDFNGVLIDDESLHLDLLQKVLHEEGVSLSAAEYRTSYIGCDDRACFNQALKGAGREVDETLLVRLVARKSSYYQERIQVDGRCFFPGAVDLVKAAASVGVTLAVVSGALRKEVEGGLDQEGLRAYFKAIVAAEDVSEGKPDPEGYHRALQHLNSQSPLPERLFHPHEVLAIEDTPTGLVAASAAGLVTLGVAHTFPESELSGADVLIPDLVGQSMEGLQEQFAHASRS